MTLLEQRLAALQEARTIVDGAGDDGLTVEQLARVDELQATATDLQAQHDRQTATAAARTTLDAQIAATSRPLARQIPEPSTAPIVVVPGHADDPMCGFRTPREFMQCVMHAGQGHAADERLLTLATVGSDEQATFSDPFGGFLVPEAMQPGVQQMEVEADPVGAATQKVPMGAPIVNLNARVDKDHSTSVSGGLRVYRRAEADTVDPSRMQFEQVRLEASALMGIAYATEEVLTDSPESFAALLAAGFGDEFAAVKLEERLNGSGAGKFMGVNNSPCLITVAKETGQAAATIVYENILKMFSRAWRPQFWLANKTTIPQLALLNISVGTGGAPIWMMSAQGGVPGSLLGMPIHYSERMNAVGTAGDLMLTNWSQYLEGNFGADGSAESIHVRFINNERAFRFSMRNAGAPWWNAPLTPKRGETQSPFVRLATRA